ncbi:MAG: CU044_5270 family protein, partial [Actinomycetota bacterium]
APAPGARADARDRLMTLATATPRRGHGRRRAVLVGAAACTVALAATATVRVAFPGDPGLERADAATVRALETGARAAEAQPPPPLLTPGRYLYTHSRGLSMVTSVGNDGASTSYLVRSDRRSWIGGDGTLRLVGRSEPARFLAGDPAVWRAEARRMRETPGPSEDRGPAALLSDIFRQAGARDAALAARADDPEAAADLLREAAPRYGGQPTEEEMFTMVGDGLRESTFSPRARAALFRAAAYIPGVELVGRTTDPLGRDGLAVARTADGTRKELVFDPRTSALLAERDVLAEPVAWLPGVPPGTVTGHTVYVTSAIVDSDTAEPRP